MIRKSRKHEKVSGDSLVQEQGEVLGKSPSTVTGKVNRLTRRGLFARQYDEDDRRTVRVTITPSGQKSFGIWSLAACLKTTETLGAYLTAFLRRVDGKIDMGQYGDK